MKKSGIMTVIVVVVIVGVIVLLTKKSDNTSDNSTATSTQQTSNQSNTQQPQASDQSSPNTITYSNNGFSSAITVKAGSILTVKNTSSKNIEFDSDPHPAHTDNKELNIGVVAPGESKTMTLNTKGTFSYHNHFLPSDKGSVTVE